MHDTSTNANVLRVPAYTVAACATVFQVTPERVYQWLRAGLLEVAQLEGGDTRLVTARSVKRLLKQRGLAITREGEPK